MENIDRFKNKKWEELSDSEKKEWQNEADEINKLVKGDRKSFLEKIQWISALLKEKKCPMCKTTFTNSHLIIEDKKIIVNPHFSFHYETTHGIPHELLNDFFKQKILE